MGVPSSCTAGMCSSGPTKLGMLRAVQQACAHLIQQSSMCCRTKMLMHRAMKSIPLVADEEAIEVRFFHRC